MNKDLDLFYLGEAVSESWKCTPSDSSYSVGAVVVTPVGEVFAGYTHETGPANHAEEEAIAKAVEAGSDLRGATIYSSMEPCSVRRSKPVSCTRLIIDSGFARVVFALEEPPRFADCCGRETLQAAGLEVKVMKELAQRVREINAHILGE